ncbi:hypothetical protein SAMN06265338_102330 [Rhodoblastus acidophilus]|uniref:Uncharacterized protein n=1 Tax=Rhodoblastus acidophilus TaxID=1074 RepID=A0A212R1E5_RHOAC|nr:hypothetical protein [Rhodoblastus acidophilus]SNB65833.1 hypothetical protein SAMN06265338_102330 [Rhodoblastus acidophilus]
MSFSDAYSLFQWVMIAAVAVFWGIALRNYLIRRQAERAAAAARDAAKLDSLRPIGLGPYEGGDPEAIAWAARREIMRVLARAPHSAVVEGERIDPAALIAALSTLHYPHAPHAPAQAPLKAVIATTAGEIVLWLERDADNRRTYWVYHPGLESTRAAPLGVISTDLLDALEPEEPARA